MVALDRWADAMAGWRRVKIVPARCLPQVSPHCTCNSCVSVCPEGAITLGASPTIRDCSACGLCAAVCTADAIALDNPSDEQLVQRFVTLSKKSSRLSLTCMDGPEGPEQVGCLGRLTPELLLAGAACGFSAIELIVGPCAGCRCVRGHDLAQEAVITTQAILHELDSPCQLMLVDAPAWKPDVAKRSDTAVAAPVYEERRAFLLSAFGLLKELLPLMPTQAAPRDPVAPQLSRRREILRWALAQLKADERTAVPWGTAGVRLTGRCYHCGVCQRLCPNGAIQTVAGMELDPQRCHACGLCIGVCPVGALSLDAPYTVGAVACGGLLSLGEANAYRCSRCGEVVEATGEGEPLCLICAVRSSHQEVLS